MKRRIRHRFVAGAGALLLLLATSIAQAGPATDVVRDKQTALFEALKQGGSDARVAGIFNEMLDYDALARASLGKEWEKRSEDERKEFTALLTELVQRAYEKNLRKTLDFKILYLGEEPAGGAVTVRTRAEHKTDKREEPIQINFKMVESGGNWRVGDIETEEVSLVESYRSQFVQLIKDKGWAALIEKMKERIAEGNG